MTSIPLNAARTIDFVTHDPDTGGIKAPASTPTFSVFEDGTSTPLAAYNGVNCTQRGAIVGNYYMTPTASSANLFVVGKSYNVHAYATVVGSVSGSSVADDAVVMSFVVVAAEAVTGYPKVDASYFSGQTITAAAPVTIPALLASTTNIAAASGIIVTSNLDKTGYSLSGDTPQTGDVYALLTQANSELVAAPASTASIITMWKWLFLLSKNKKTETATAQSIYDNTGTVIIATATISDDTVTATAGKWA